MSLAPIALFAYNRPRHVQQAVESLLRNELAPESDLYIFSDAPATAAAAAAVQQVRRYIRAIRGFSSISIVERTINLGLADSIIDGVTRLCREHGRVIVLEDDLVLSPYFLKYMNDALALYEHEENVISIHGYIYPVGVQLPETFFIRGADCWGWATWARGWALFEKNGATLMQKIKRRGLKRRFDLNGAYPYSRMLQNQIAGRNDSWAVRWHASAFLEERLTLYPGRTLVCNIGNDSSGTHGGTTDIFLNPTTDRPIPVNRIPITENQYALDQIESFFRRQRRSMLSRIKDAFTVGSKIQP